MRIDMNITLPVKSAMNMNAPIIIINSIEISYTTIIIYGLFALMIFIGLAVWIMTFKKGGN
jgi:hypothetical protein